MFTNPTVTDFKNCFVRDFPYGIDQQTVMDSDIQQAMVDCGIMINPALFSTQDQYTQCYLLLSAHYLVTNLRNSSQGLAGQYNFLQGSKGVGSVSESFSIPQSITENPLFSMYCKTNYGAKYISFILPLLAGQMFSVRGGAHA